MIDVYIKDMIDQWFIINFVGFWSKSILLIALLVIYSMFIMYIYTLQNKTC